ncbi:MAG: glycosyltransferase family 4 protein [Pseudomonadota bacterium]
MKIALIRKDYFHSRGGGERYVVNLSEALANLGHEVHVLSHTWEEPALSGITVHKVPTITISSSLKNLSFAYNCRKLLAKENFDIIHSLSQTFPQDVYRMGDGIHRHWLRIQTPNPMFRFLKRLTIRQQVILWLEKRTFHSSNYRMIICNSQLCKRHAIKYFKVPEERICVIYNGVDHTTFHPGLRDEYNNPIRKRLKIPGEAFVILFIARNFRRKGLDQLINALPLIKIRKEFIKVLIAGRGDTSYYRRIAAHVGVGEQLLFVGESDTIFQFYGVGDILVLPTFYDPFSNVCLEALACGIPVVTTRENGAAEIIKPGETGVVLSDPANCGELADGIVRFISSEVGDSVRKKAVRSVQHFTIEENARQTLEVYQRVLLMKQKSVKSADRTFE